jgi:hypothetical protein
VSTWRDVQSRLQLADRRKRNDRLILKTKFIDKTIQNGFHPVRAMRKMDITPTIIMLPVALDFQ